MVLALACLVAFSFQGSRGLYETTEGRYGEAGREMLETGNWWIPQLGYHPHLTKPPLTYWAIAAGIAVLGQNEWGVRLYLAVASVFIVWAVYGIALVLWDSRTALFAGSLYACAPAAVYGLSSVSTDEPLALFELLMVLCYCHPWRGSGKAGLWRVGFWLSAGLGFMTKGPLPFLLLAALFVHNLFLRRKHLGAVSIFSGPGPWLGAIVGCSWFLVLLWRDPGLWSFFFGQEVYGRVFTDQHHRNPHWYGPVVVYLPVLLLGLGPAMLTWFWLPKKHPGKRLDKLILSHPTAALLTFWILIPLIVLSISRSRLPLYVLPLFPAVALATARAMQLWFDGPRMAILFKRYILAMVVLAILGKAAAAHLEVDADSRRLSRFVRSGMSEDTFCFIFESDGLYGLDFYLGGRAERIHKSPPGSPGVTGAEEFRSEIAKHPNYRHALFATDAKWATDRLRKLLQAENLEVSETRQLGHYSTVLVALPACR